MHSTPLPTTKTAPGSQDESRNDEECAVVSPDNGDVDRSPDDAKLFAPSSVVDAASKLSRSAHFFSLRLMMQMAEEGDEVPPLEEILEESKPMKGPLPSLVEATSKLSPSAHFFSQRLMVEISDSMYPFDDDDDDDGDTSDTPTSENDEPNPKVNPPSRIVEILDSILERRLSPVDPKTGKKRQAASLEDRRKRHKNTTGRPRRVTLDLLSGTAENREQPPPPNGASSKP